MGKRAAQRCLGRHRFNRKITPPVALAALACSGRPESGHTERFIGCRLRGEPDTSASAAITT
jgi:hypothetical protein